MPHNANDTLVFLKVAELGSFAAAARALRLPKTTVSRKVRELELHLGAQLLHRTTRRLALTEAGALYYSRSARIAGDLAGAEQAVMELSGAVRGTLRVTVPFSLATAMLAPLLAELGVRHPALQVELILSNDRLDLIEHEIDLALRLSPDPLPDSDLAARRLCGLSLGLYAAPGYLALHGAPREPADLAKHRTLALRAHRRGDGYRWRLHADDGRTVDAELQPGVIAGDPDPLVQTAVAGGGILMAGAAMLANELADGRLQRVLPEWSGPRLLLHAMYPRERLPAPKLRAFIDYLVEWLDRHGHDSGPHAAEVHVVPPRRGTVALD
ncbi:LysR family transcriptional regulator [Cognatilysobacter tabacisoli]|uniref:LysR family transcriptional regulator n=1 Tax=Cognatilysobacter tabacisoli TaxID=2315424 RepID=UPI000E6B1FE7|nr:LysR family transcriptional regulator [Lysobacter tabacisoli]